MEIIPKTPLAGPWGKYPPRKKGGRAYGESKMHHQDNSCGSNLLSHSRTILHLMKSRPG